MLSAARLAWLQLRREKVRLAIALAGVGFAVVLVFMQLGFMDALFRSAVNVHGRLNADVVLVHPNYNILPRPTYFSRRRLYQALGFPGVASVTAVHFAIAHWKHPVDGSNQDIFVLGVDPAGEALTAPGMADALRLVRYPDRAIFDEASRPEFGPVPALFREHGAVSTEVNDRRLTIQGLFRLGTSFGVDGTILTSDLNFRRLFPGYPPGGVGLGLVRVQPGADPRTVRDALVAGLPHDVRVLTKSEFMRAEVAYWSTKTPIGFVFAFGVVIGLVVGMIIVYQILFADIADHLAEYATLKAMGYANRYLSTVVVMEATILALLGYLPGMAIALWLFDVAHRATMLPMVIAFDRAAEVLGLTLAMCWASGLIAMRKLRTLDPADVF
jgi:putative ABC transport system permease protein